MKVQFTLTTDEVQALIAEGLRRRGLIRKGTEAGVFYYSNNNQIPNVTIAVMFNTAIPKETAPEEDSKKPPRSALERLGEDE